jgi:hypothetical protein
LSTQTIKTQKALIQLAIRILEDSNSLEEGISRIKELDAILSVMAQIEDQQPAQDVGQLLHPSVLARQGA